MAALTLPTSTYGSKAQGPQERLTIIEDLPQISVRKCAPASLQKTSFTSPLSDNFPTPRGNMLSASMQDDAASPTSSDTQSDDSSLFSKRSSKSEYDSLYDITESESEGDVPIKLSSSIKRRVARRSRYPSIAIPSPSQWPTIEKMKGGVTPLSPPVKVEVDSHVLKQLQSLRVPNQSATPSLDGSATDEEFALSSCPSTPDIARPIDDEKVWEAPMQLDPSSIALLDQINGEESEPMETIVEVPEASSEMREVVESPPLTARMRLNTTNLAPPTAEDADDELSALSVPSPGGFFASLDSSVARSAWTSTTDAVPNTGTATEFYGVPFRSDSLPTSTATSFYGVPWQQRPENPIEHTIALDSPKGKTDPITARRVAFSPIEAIQEVDEIDETYDDAMQKTASANIDRTALWLNAQSDYMKAVCEDDVTESFENIEDAIPSTPEQVSPVSEGDSPSKKSVRFADIDATEAKKAEEIIQKRISPIHDGTFWEGWRHQKRSQRARDVFQHRQARAEAEHVKRTSCQQQHLDQLRGKFEITSAQRPTPSRPISNMLAATPEDEQKEILQRAERERQALEQMQTSAWHVSAQKEINGGKLLTSPIVQTFKGRDDVRILDLAGQVHCSWAWDVAAEHPEADVYSTVPTDVEAHVAQSTLEGPSNHFVVAAPKTWELPFDNNYFDVISARNFYSHLKTTWPKGQAADEWDLTLRECLRCLKPGGYLEFDLLDAELVHPESSLQALGVEFAFNLKTRGYDPTSGKNFLPRLKRAGFSSIKRAWMVLPVGDVLPKWTDTGKRASQASSVERTIGANGDVELYEAPMTGSTKDVRAMTGIVGSRMWEQWMLKLNSEMGRSEERCLEGVAKALEEGGRGNAGWRCLVGWARKA